MNVIKHNIRSLVLKYHLIVIIPRLYSDIQQKVVQPPLAESGGSTPKVYKFICQLILKLKGKLYMTSVRSAMVHESKMWATTAEQSGRLECTEMRMVRWMCGVLLREGAPSAALRNRMGIESVSDAMKRNRLRWLGHVLWKRSCHLRWKVREDR